MIELSLNGIKKYMDTNLILENINFQVYSGEKVGIVGANGCGKSTILKLIAGIIELNCYAGSVSLGYDQGSISLTRGATTAYLDQLPEYPDGLRVVDVLDLAFEEVHELEEEMRKLEEQMQKLEGEALEKTLKKYSDLQQQFEVKGGYDMEEKLSKVCKGLELDDEFLNKEFNVLSGGEKTTVILGKILIENPDVLLLDEPTNHLDLNAMEWLENYLKGYKGIVIIVSHDRYFLDNVVTKIVEIEDKVCETFNGNYSTYTRLKEESMLKQFEDFKEQQKQIESMEKTIKSLRDWAIRADNKKFFQRAASMQKKLDKMERIKRPVFDKQNMKLDLNAKARSGNETIKAEALFKSYGTKTLFDDAELLVHYGERVAMIGANGSGKTTFLKMLLGEEQADGGNVQIGASVRHAYLPQNIVFDDEEMTVVECFRDDISILEGKAREYLSKYMFFGSSVFKKVRHLSGGERIRLKLAKLLYEDINLLILDEPTNHLDIDSIETLEEALDDFNGTIFFISHDRYFINKIGERIVAIEDARFASYPGNYDYYKSKRDEVLLAAQASQAEAAEKAKLAASAKASSVRANKELDPLKAEKKRETEMKRIELEIERLESEISGLDLAMEAELDHEELNRLFCRRGDLSKELELVMDRWVSLG